MGLELGHAGDLWSSADLIVSPSEVFFWPEAQIQDSEERLQRFVEPPDCSFSSVPLWAPVIMLGESSSLSRVTAKVWGVQRGWRESVCSAWRREEFGERSNT